MKTTHTSTRGFMTAQLAIVIALIIGGTGLLAYEWSSSHTAKTHEHSSGSHHHKKHHEEKTASTN